jgi:hypothetical protein
MPCAAQMWRKERTRLRGLIGRQILVVKTRPMFGYDDAVAAYRDALALEPARAVRQHISAQIAALGAAHAPIEET